MRTIKIDNRQENIWIIQIKKVVPTDFKPSQDRTAFLPSKKRGKEFKKLRLMRSRCTFKLLLSDRSLTYIVDGFFHPDLIVAIDTNQHLVFTEFKNPIMAKMRLAPLSDSESALVAIEKLRLENDDFRCELKAMAEGHLKLRKENEELQQLHAKSYFEFAKRVDSEDFCALLAIFALGNRNAAAEYLKIPIRSFYDRVEKWKSAGPPYKMMFRLVASLKTAGRGIKLRLPDSLQSGEPGHNAENPEITRALFAQLKENQVDCRDYPAIFREVLEAIQNQKPENWQDIRKELISILKGEL